MRGLRGTLCVIALSLVILVAVLFVDSTHVLREPFAGGGGMNPWQIGVMVLIVAVLAGFAISAAQMRPLGSIRASNASYNST